MLSGSHKDENGKYQFLNQHEEERDPLLRLRTKYGSTEQDETGRALELESESVRQEEIIKDDEIPVIVRESVALEDDVNLPVITFRYFLLSTLFVIPGAFIDTMNTYRTTAAAYSIFFVQIACHWAGKWLAEVLPKKTVSVFRWSFNLNPGPWSIKETAMITITASSGATGNLATNAISLADLRFGEKVHPATAIAFMWAIVFVGYSYGAIAKDLVLYDPQLPWPQALMQTTLLSNPRKGGQRSQTRRQTNEALFHGFGIGGYLAAIPGIYFSHDIVFGNFMLDSTEQQGVEFSRFRLGRHGSTQFLFRLGQYQLHNYALPLLGAGDSVHSICHRSVDTTSHCEMEQSHQLPPWINVEQSFHHIRRALSFFQIIERRS